MAYRLLPSSHVRRVRWVVCCLVVGVVVAVEAAGGEEVPPRTAQEGRSPAAPSPAVVQERQRTIQSVRLERIEVARQPGPLVRLRLSAPAQPLARALPAEGGAPDRISVEVLGSTLAPALPQVTPGAGPVLRVRAQKAGVSTARAVIDLERAMPFTLTSEGATVTVALGAPAVSAALEADPAEQEALVAAGRSEEAGAAEREPAAQPPETAEPPPPQPAAATVTRINGVPFVWPVLDAPEYASDREAAELREVLARWQRGDASGRVPSAESRSPAARYLAADLTFLEATAGRAGYFQAAMAYQRALREAPDFSDAPRGEFMLGQANLALGFGPEAGVAFLQLERRFPTSSLVFDARLGQAAALRLRRHLAEARRLVESVLPEASGELACRARVEQAAVAETPVATVDAFRRLGEVCPQALADPAVLHDYAEALVGVGDREEARRMLARPREAGGGDREARLRLLAAALAPDADSSRAEYERVLGMRVTPAVALEAEMRLALLDADDRPARAGAALAALARGAGPRALRAAILGELAELHARTGRFDEALGVLDRAAALGPEGAAQAEGRRAEILGRWIAALAQQGDDAGIATVYAAYATDVDEIAAPEDRLAVARALGHLGLHANAARLLGRGAQETREPAFTVALAEEALAAGDLETARVTAAALAKQSLPAELARRARAAGTRAALLAGDHEAAAAAAAESDDLDLRVAVATALLARPGGAAAASALLQPALAAAGEPPVRVLLVAGAAALAEGAWDAAAEVYRRALAGGAVGSARAEAAAGLARANRERGDAAGVALALAELARAGGALGPTLAARLAARAAALPGAGDRHGDGHGG